MSNLDITQFQIQRVLLWLCIVTTLPFLSACSVGMAMSGQENPDVSVLRVGSTRLDVERELGAPQNSRVLDDGGVEATYQYELGNEPSAGRAVAHGALDVLTLGLWEVVGTPIEASQGNNYEVTIVYDAENVVRSITASD